MHAALGAVAALAALTRGEAVLLLVLLVTLVSPAGPGHGGPPLTALVTAVVVLAPWTIRNAVVFHRFVLISNDFGAVIGGANCDATYYSTYIGAWSLGCNHPPPGNEAQEAGDEMSAGLRYASHHVHRLPKVVAARELRVWGLLDPFETNSGRDATVQDIGVITYYLLLTRGVAGVVVLRRRRAPVWTVVAPIVTVAIVAGVGYGFMRLREPADISLVILAGVALDAGLRKYAGPARQRLAHGRPA